MSRPARVLHVLNSAGGGAALSTIALIDALKADGVTSCAVCHDSGSPQERQQLTEAVEGRLAFTSLYWWNRKIRAPLWKRPLAEARQIVRTGWSLGSASRVAECAAAWNVELIHTNTMVIPEGGRAARRLCLPHVWHLRELVGPGNPFRLPREGASLGRYLSSHCSKLVANSEASARVIRGWLPNDMLEVVPNGIDIERFASPRVQIGAAPLIVAMVGNLTSRTKKHSLFIEAASLVDRSLKVEWRIYGHESPQDEFARSLRQQVADAGLAERFTWPGFVDDPARIMAEIDLLVHPADNESFGRIVVEAMAAGLPAVGVNGGGVADIIDPEVTGLLAAKDDPRDLARCIERLARDAALRQSMGAAGRRRAIERYSLSACAARVLAVYEQAMARPLGNSAERLTHSPYPEQPAEHATQA